MSYLYTLLSERLSLSLARYVRLVDRVCVSLLSITSRLPVTPQAYFYPIFPIFIIRMGQLQMLRRWRMTASAVAYPCSKDERLQ